MHACPFQTCTMVLLYIIPVLHKILLGVRVILPNFICLNNLLSGDTRKPIRLPLAIKKIERAWLRFHFYSHPSTCSS